MNTRSSNKLLHKKKLFKNQRKKLYTLLYQGVDNAVQSTCMWISNCMITFEYKYCMATFEYKYCMPIHMGM